MQLEDRAIAEQRHTKNHDMWDGELQSVPAQPENRGRVRQHFKARTSGAARPE
jgi:hypothetical protein